MKKMEVKVLGKGCQRCHDLAAQAEAALKELGIEAAVEHVTDLKEIMKYGVLSTPALVLNGKVKCAGRVPSPEEIKTWLSS
jgi:small redox-active disulfide protein 2